MSVTLPEHLPRRVLLGRLPDDGAPGWTSYRPPGEAPSFEEALLAPDDAARVVELGSASDTGSVLFIGVREATLIVPPFPVEHHIDYSEQYVAPLVELIERRRAVAVFLLRLGGFSVGFFRGEALADSKTDRRFVKNRHRKGGQSQRRFDRIREKQVYELFEKGCEEAREKLTEYEDEIQHVLFGGDRLTLLAFRKQCRYFDRFGDRVLKRVLPVAGNPRRESLDVIPREIWSSDLYTFPVTRA